MVAPTKTMGPSRAARFGLDWKDAMKRRLATALMMLCLSVPLAVEAQGYPPRGRTHDGGEYGARGGYGQGGGHDRGAPERGGYGGEDDRRGFAGRPGDDEPWIPSPRPNRYAEPPEPALRRGHVPAYSDAGRPAWSRGQYLPPQARGEVIQDFGRYHLRRPPRGYYWYRAGDDYVLAAIASGVIFEVIQGDDGY